MALTVSAVQPLRLKSIIQQYSWENEVLKEQEEEELLPVWMIYCLFTDLMELLRGMWESED